MNTPDKSTSTPSNSIGRNSAVDAWNDDAADVASISRLPPVAPLASSAPMAAAAPTAGARPITASLPGEETMLQSALTPLMLMTGIYLLLSAFSEVVWQMRVPEIGNVQWRFVALGVLAPNLLILSIGNLFITAAAMRASRPIFARLWMIYSTVAAVAMLLLIPLYALDTLQIRPILPATMSGRFLVMSVVKTIFAYVGAALLAILCTITTRRALRVERERAAATLRAWSA